MGYFNYFIKCIIRNITYKLCKPKVFVVVLLSIILLMCFKNYGYCSTAEGQAQLVNPNNDFVDVSGNITGTIQYDNQFLSVKTIQEEIQREFILKLYSMYSTNQASAVQISSSILEKVRAIALSSEGAGDNVGIYIQRAGAASQYRVNFYKHKDLTTAIGYGAYVNFNLYFLNVPYQVGIVERYNLDNNTYWSLSNSELELQIPVPMIGVFVPEWIDLFRDFGLINSPEKESLQALQQQNNLINEQNKLQEEQNQIQQEQNDILTNDDVDTDNLGFATNDTVNPTSDGFNTLFTSIYNAFCNTSSAPLKVTLPFVNQSFTISPNLVSNAMQKCGLGVVVTLIQSYYYYGVCLFIYKDINKIIEHLKSGNLTADCGNVKTEVL